MRVSLLDALGLTPDRAKAAPRTSSAPPSADQFATARTVIRDSKGWDLEHAVEEGYRACSMVYTCVRILGDQGASLPWKIMRRKKGKAPLSLGEWEVEEGHPLELAIEYPANLKVTGYGLPDRQISLFSRAQLMKLMIAQLCLIGESLVQAIYVTRGGSAELHELWPLSPKLWRPVVGEGSQWISHYERSDRREQPLRIDQVVHPVHPNPANVLKAIGPLHAAVMAVNLDRAHAEWNASLPEHAMAGQIAFVDRSLTTSTQVQEAADRIRQRFASKANAGAPVVLGEGGEVHQLSMTPEQLGWNEARQLNMQEIALVFGVDPAMIAADAKFANKSEATANTWRIGTASYMSMIEDAINARVLDIKERRDTWIHYDTSGVEALKNSLEKRLEGFERAVSHGIVPNAAITLMDLPVMPTPEGEVALIKDSLVPLKRLLEEPQSAEAGATPPAEPGDADPEDDPVDIQDEEGAP